MNGKLLYKQRGSTSIGKGYPLVMQIPWPFGNIKVYEDGVVVSSTEIKFSELIKVKTKTGKVLIFEHNGNVPQSVQFFTRKKNIDLLKVLKDKGVTIEYV
jgi:hypothetical protein